MQKKKTLDITRTAVFAALIFVATQFVKIPMLLGYANMGDCFVILAGWTLGSYGCVASIIGSVLADILSGYVIYVPASVLIKALMPLVSYKGFQFAKRFAKKKKYLVLIISAVITEVIMVIGYFLYETMLYGIEAASISLVGNMLQGLLAVIVSNILFSKKVIDK